MSILVVGHGGHGKSKFCELLSKELNVKSLSSSEVAFPYIYPTLKMVFGYENETQAILDKKNKREVWRVLIELFNANDKKSLTKLILSKAKIYDGMRSDIEYKECKHLFKYQFWIFRPDAEKDPSMKVHFNPFQMNYIDNSSDLEYLKLKAFFWAEKIKNDKF